MMPVSEGFVGDKMLHRSHGKTFITPLLICIFALGTADLMFAVDSIPAVFGLTNEPYIVFAANAFALLGLRQLYFLIDGLLDRLVYLHYGLAAILGFIGVKLVIHALHENELPFINGGEHWDVIPEPTIVVSLAWIVGVLTITVLTSLAKNRKDARIAAAERSVAEARAANQRHVIPEAPADRRAAAGAASAGGASPERGVRAGSGGRRARRRRGPGGRGHQHPGVIRNRGRGAPPVPRRHGALPPRPPARAGAAGPVACPE